jgi:hypothetical protein
MNSRTLAVLWRRHDGRRGPLIQFLIWVPSYEALSVKFVDGALLASRRSQSAQPHFRSAFQLFRSYDRLTRPLGGADALMESPRKGAVGLMTQPQPGQFERRPPRSGIAGVTFPRFGGHWINSTES